VRDFVPHHALQIGHGAADLSRDWMLTVSCITWSKVGDGMRVGFVVALGHDERRELRGNVHIRQFQRAAREASQPSRAGRATMADPEARVGAKSLLPTCARPCVLAKLASAICPRAALRPC